MHPDLLTRAMEMRHAIDILEGALMGCGRFVDLPKIFDGSEDDIEIAPKLRLGDIRRVCNALKECTRIINSDDYTANALSTAQPSERG
jgi:hypothetical protein